MGRNHYEPLARESGDDETILDLPTRGASRARRRRAVIASAALAAVLFTVCLLSLPTTTLFGRPPHGWLDGFNDECRDWNPTDPSTDSECPASARLREAQSLLHAHGEEFPPDVASRLHKLVGCSLGLTRCDERPLILGLLRPLEPESEEARWRQDVINAIEAHHFVYIPASGPRQLQRLARALSSHLHSVIMDEISAVECIQNPRCVRPEDFVPSPRSEQAHPTAEELGDDVGAIPMWRILVASWYGSRPEGRPWPGGEATHTWGEDVPAEDLAYPWAYNPLGRRWIISPWAYPEHHFIPPSILTTCAKTDEESAGAMPPRAGKQDRSVLLLGDAADAAAKVVDWDGVHARVLEQGYNLTFVSTAANIPVPGRYGFTPPASVSDTALLGRADAVLALGAHLSIAPFVAMCKGTPVLTPRFQASKSRLRPAGWTGFDSTIFQHGPLSAVGEPFSHTYLAESTDELARALVNALQADFGSYLPREYNVDGRYERTRKMLRYPYERKYNSYIRAHRKDTYPPPTLAQQLRDRCWDEGWCKPGPYPED